MTDREKIELNNKYAKLNADLMRNGWTKGTSKHTMEQAREWADKNTDIFKQDVMIFWAYHYSTKQYYAYVWVRDREQ